MIDLALFSKPIEPYAFVIKAEVKQEPKEKLYTVKEGDSLTVIAAAQASSVARLWQKNTQLSSPDVIKPGDVLTVPMDGEQLAERALPEPVVIARIEVPIKQTHGPTQSPPKSGGFSSSKGSGGLTGSIGSVSPYGNCVNEPGVNKWTHGNPEIWPVLTQTPVIGGTVLFTYNHTGVITGLWDDGSIEIRHQNYRGGQTRFPRSAFRGFR